MFLKFVSKSRFWIKNGGPEASKLEENQRYTYTFYSKQHRASLRHRVKITIWGMFLTSQYFDRLLAIK